MVKKAKENSWLIFLQLIALERTFVVKTSKWIQNLASAKINQNPD